MQPGQISPIEDQRINCLVTGISKSLAAPAKKKSGFTVPLVLAALQYLLQEGQEISLLNIRTAACLTVQFFLTARHEEAKRLMKSGVVIYIYNL